MVDVCKSLRTKCGHGAALLGGFWVLSVASSFSYLAFCNAAGELLGFGALRWVKQETFTVRRKHVLRSY